MNILSIARSRFNKKCVFMLKSPKELMLDLVTANMRITLFYSMIYYSIRVFALFRSRPMLPFITEEHVYICPLISCIPFQTIIENKLNGNKLLIFCNPDNPSRLLLLFCRFYFNYPKTKTQMYLICTSSSLIALLQLEPATIQII